MNTANIEWKSSTKLVSIKIPEIILKEVLKFAEELDRKKNTAKRVKIQHTPEQLAKLSPDQLKIYNSMLGYNPLGARQYAENILRVLENRCSNCGNEKVIEKDENNFYVTHCPKCNTKDEIKGKRIKNNVRCQSKDGLKKKRKPNETIKKGKRLSLEWKELKNS